MREFARNEFTLSAPQGDGATLRTHLQRGYVNTRVADPRLDVRCPDGCEELWQAFNTLARPITQQEIAAWQANHASRLSAWEIDTLYALDRIAAEIAFQHQHKAAPS